MLFLSLGSFLLLNKDTFYYDPWFFFLTTCDSHGTLHLALGLVGMHSSAFMWAMRKFSFRVRRLDDS